MTLNLTFQRKEHVERKTMTASAAYLQLAQVWKTQMHLNQCRKIGM